VDGDVFHQERAVHIDGGEVEAHLAGAVAGAEGDVLQEAEVVGVELERDRAEVAAAGVDGEVGEVVVEPVGGGVFAVLAAVEAVAQDGPGLAGVGERVVLQAEDGLVAAGAVEVAVAVAVAGLVPERAGDEVGAGGEVEGAAAALVLVDRALEGGGVVGLAVGLGGVGGAGDVDDAGVGRVRTDGRGRWGRGGSRGVAGDEANLAEAGDVGLAAAVTAVGPETEIAGGDRGGQRVLFAEEPGLPGALAKRNFCGIVRQDLASSEA
jgi:hypothetical protein